LLARRILTRDETPNCKLSTLAIFFRAAEQPCHRALADARATVDVLHGLFERLGPLGVTTMDELRTFTGMVPAAVRRKRHLADDLPNGPGVYLFRDGQGRALYIGTSRNVRTRVRSYFTASELRTRMAEMVGIAESIDAVPCAHSLEAEVRELRLIAELQPAITLAGAFDLAEAHRRAVSAAVAGSPGARRRGHLSGSLRFHPAGRARRDRAA
jgi:DNA polymerase III subunit epsilon